MRSSVLSCALLLGAQSLAHAQGQGDVVEEALPEPVAEEERVPVEVVPDSSKAESIDSERALGEEQEEICPCHPEAPEPELKSSKKKKKSLKWKGRIFALSSTSRQELAGQTFWRNEQEIRSARIGMVYKEGNFRGEVEFEVEKGEPKLRDANMRLQTDGDLRVTAGRMKKPISTMALDSRWDLPSIDRGLLETVRVENADLEFAGGRQEGLKVEQRLKKANDLRLTLAAFQNKIGEDLDASENFGQDLYARVSIEPAKDWEIASSVALIGYLGTIGDASSYGHAPIVSLETVYRGSKIRIWAEAFTGESFFAKSDGTTSGRFLAARSLVAPRFRTGTPRRLIPYLSASYFDPRSTEKRDGNWQLQGGVSLQFQKIWRLQAAVSQTFARGDSSPGLESTEFAIQLAGRFKK